MKLKAIGNMRNAVPHMGLQTLNRVLLNLNCQLFCFSTLYILHCKLIDKVPLYLNEYFAKYRFNLKASKQGPSKALGSIQLQCF